MKIVVLDGYTLNPGDISWDALHSLGDVTIYDRTDSDQVISRSKGAQIVLTNKVVINKNILDSLADLKYIGVLATGYNVVDTEEARKRGITVTNIPAYSTDAVVQMVFAHILNIYNQVAHYSLEVRNGKWSASKDFCFTDTTLFELHGKKMAIIGLGHIGMAVSKLAIAFGMEILAVTSKKQDQLPEGYKVVDLKTAFKECDILSLHCPLSDDTKHIVNKETLAMMKKNAVIINTGRGPLIDDMALADALNNELIVAAGIDVLTHEPPVPENPLLKAKNCFITPHIAWAAYEARQRLLSIAIDNIKSFIEGNIKNSVIK